jgi:hypothetical protein
MARVVTTRTQLKDFNPVLLSEEVAAIFPLFGLNLLGFDAEGRFLRTPAAGTKAITTVNGVATRTAEPGEIVLETGSAPTAQEIIDYDNVLANHVATNQSAVEIAEALDETDLDAIEADYLNYESLNKNSQDALVQKTLRIVLRREGRI